MHVRVPASCRRLNMFVDVVDEVIVIVGLGWDGDDDVVVDVDDVVLPSPPSLLMFVGSVGSCSETLC